MKCPKCGNELDKNTKYCSNCGKKIKQKISQDEKIATKTKTIRKTYKIFISFVFFNVFTSLFKWKNLGNCSGFYRNITCFNRNTFTKRHYQNF